MATTTQRPRSAVDSGRNATSPWAMPAKGWKQVLGRTWKESGEDNVGLIAAGVAFYGFLAMVPLLGAIVLSYGLIVSPATVIEQVRSLTTMMPKEAATLVGDQLLNIVGTSGGKKGFGLLIALALALYGAMKGAQAIVTALNIAYEEKETRGFVKLNLLALAITVGAVLVAIIAIGAIGALGHLDTVFPSAPDIVLTLGRLASYVLLAGITAAGTAALYRYGPDRAHAKWTWLTPGSALATALWLIVTLGFGFYVANFGSYDATYGSLGAVVVLLTWLYLSSYVLILGGELNSELEHQTAEDTTTGAPVGLGQRRATVADKVAGGPAPTVQPEMKASPTSTPSFGKDLLAARVGERGGRLAGLGKVGMLPSLLATGGLALLRGRGRRGLGAALLAASGGLAWLGRKK